MVARNTLVLALLSVALLCFAAQSLTAQRLVASYPFSGNASDASGNGHNGTVNGATLTEDRFGNANAAYNFDGTNDYISVPHSSALNFPFTYSISLWVKFCVSQRPGTNVNVIINKGASKGAGYNIQRAIPAEKIWFGPYRVGSGSVTTATSNLNDGRWHHVVAVYESTTRDPTREYSSIYLDGVLEGTEDDDQLLTYTNTDDLWIGRSISSPLLFYFKGAIDDINIYDTMLTAAQVSALYRANGWPKAAQPNTLNLSIAASDTVICPGKTVQLSLLGNPTEVTWNPSPTLQGPLPPCSPPSPPRKPQPTSSKP
ncbi:MAG: LamG domain-containing protein [Chlorobi bacterium]|nr:LamG domain-containing protein [Chlorobiota bacterium]